MKVVHGSIAHKDARGWIADVVQDTPFEHATIIVSRMGASRGHHFHKETVQWVFLLSGRLQALVRMNGGPVEQVTLRPFDSLRTDPMEEHALIALEQSTFLVLTHGPRGGAHYEDDTYRLESPLVAP